MAAGRAAWLAVCVLALPATTGLQLEDTECAFSDRLQEAEPQSRPTNELGGVVRQNDTVRCSHGSRCFGLWEKSPGGKIQPVKQGCWPHVGSQQECHSDRCQITAPPSQIQNGNYRFCCCSRNLCNTYFTEAPHTVDTPTLVKTDNKQTARQPLQREEMVLISLLIVAIAAVVIIAWFLGHRMMRDKKKKDSLSAMDVMEAANTDSAVELDSLKLMELIGRGRYGTVFRGCLHERCVAVKLFSSANRQNYINERSIYSLPLLQQHDNIARFLSADERKTADGRPEFLIVMDFYPHGCLSHYLSVHTVDWSACCRMNHGVTRGLAFLHTELNRGDQYKPAVAHRDVTSRNILVRADLSCVLADFGLSMRLTGSRTCCPVDNDTMAISEVGTVRYMAPEVLVGALNLRDCEAALKQVDVYALGLLYWETFRRCSELFPGEAVPEYQLAFQAELGNHPSFEEMQILVAREKFRPRFPEAWKENCLVLRSLKETMEDCWDQDAEARLTAQCAEERLCELALLSTHTAIQNHRNLCHARSPPQTGSASTNIEDVQVGVVNNLQGDSHSASVVKTTESGATGVRKNRNSVNYKQQLAQAWSFRSECNVLSGTAKPPVNILCSISDSGCSSGAVAIVPICLQLTEEDLEATKLNPEEVDKNLRERSDEDLMEISQKKFFPTGQQTTNLLYHQILRTAEVETGVATMNTVTVATAVEPHPVTTVTNNTSMRGSVGNQVHGIMSNGYNVSVPTSVTNGIIGAGKINPAGPKLKEEEKFDRGTIEQEDDCMNLLNSNPDEQEPLLRREQLPAKSTSILHQYHRHSKPGDIPTGRGSNSNNNNNRTTLVSGVKGQGFAVESQRKICSKTSQEGSINSIKPESHLASSQISGYLASQVVSNHENKILFSDPVRSAASDSVQILQAPPTGEEVIGQGSCTDPCVQSFLFAEPVFSPPSPRNLETHLVQSTTIAPVSVCGYPDSGSASSSVTQALDAQVLPETQPLKLSDPEALVRIHTVPLENPAPETPTFSSGGTESTPLRGTSASESVLSPALVPQNSELLRPQIGPVKAKRPERPSSLDLSSACISSDDVSLIENGSLSTSGEKIKQRVKTPYTLKKWRPTSWVVSTDTALDLDLDFQNSSSSSSSQTHFSSGPHRAGSIGIPNINQSKSSMAVFLVGGGATATKTSQPDGMTSF